MRMSHKKLTIYNRTTRFGIIKKANGITYCFLYQSQIYSSFCESCLEHEQIAATGVSFLWVSLGLSPGLRKAFS